jgi:heat shock protein HslJ
MRRTMSCCAISLLLLGVSILAGCGGEQGGTGGRLEGVVWVLESYEDAGAMQNVPGNTRIDALFEGGKVSGSSGVNTYSASYESSDSTLTIGPAVTTMMAGREDAMALEQVYLEALGKAASFTATADALTIYGSDGGELLTYVAEEAPSLVRTTWSVIGYNNGKGGVVSPIVGSELTAVFSEDGQVSGSSGVNTFSGDYSLDGNRITIGPLATTLMASQDPQLMEQETAYVAALQSASIYSIRGDRLELRREDGALAASFEAKD